MAKEHEIQALDKVIQRLATRFTGVSQTEIEVVVYEEYGKLHEGNIRDFVPVLVERASKLRLAHLNPR